MKEMKDSIFKSKMAINDSNQIQIKADKEALKGEINKVKEDVKKS